MSNQQKKKRKKKSSSEPMTEAQAKAQMEENRRKIQAMELAQKMYNHLAEKAQTVHQATVIPQVAQMVISREWEKHQKQLPVKELQIKPLQNASLNDEDKKYTEFLELLNDVDVAMAMDACSQLMNQIQQSVEAETAETPLVDYKNVFSIQRDAEKSKEKTEE